MATAKRVVRRPSVRRAVKVSTRAPRAEAPVPAASFEGKKWHYLLFGLAFGYFITKSGATDYNRILDMFTGHDWKLMCAFLTAAVITALGIFLLQKNGSPTVKGGSINWKIVEFRKDRLIGAALFGVGWVLAGACPATAIAQLGEGKLMAIFTLVGILVGAWGYGYWTGGQDDPGC